MSQQDSAVLIARFREAYPEKSGVLDAWFDGEFIIYHLDGAFLMNNPVEADFEGYATVITLFPRSC